MKSGLPYQQIAVWETISCSAILRLKKIVKLTEKTGKQTISNETQKRCTRKRMQRVLLFKRIQLKRKTKSGAESELPNGRAKLICLRLRP